MTPASLRDRRLESRPECETRNWRVIHERTDSQLSPGSFERAAQSTTQIVRRRQNCFV